MKSLDSAENISVFNEYAEAYDSWYFKEENLPIFLSELKVIQKLGVEGIGAEIGVGTGVFASRLKIPLGVDPALNMLKIAKERKIEVIRAVAESLPFKDETLDQVLYVVTICFLNEPETALAETRRILKEDGRLILCFISKNSELGKFYLRKKKEGHKIYRYAKFYSRKNLFKMLENSGFKIDDYAGTLSHYPCSKPVFEEPKENLEKCGFICVKASKL